MTQHDTQTTTGSLPGRILGWLRAGYPEGIPAQDYVPLLGVLRRNLTDADIAAISADLAAQSLHEQTALTEADIRRMIEEAAVQQASPSDVARVSAHLAAGGWPLTSEM